MSCRLLLDFGRYTGVYCISLLFVCLRRKFTKRCGQISLHIVLVLSTYAGSLQWSQQAVSTCVHVRICYVGRMLPKQPMQTDWKYKSGWIVRYLYFAWQDWLAYDFYVQNLDCTLREHTLMLTYQRCELRFIYLHHLLFEWELICHDAELKGGCWNLRRL